MRTALALLTLSALATPAAQAQDGRSPGLRATVDRTEITTADRIVLSLTVIGAQESIPRLPDLPDFEVRQAGTSTQLQIVNGRSSGSVSYNYVLFPKKPGTFVIPPATLEVGGAKVESQPITVKVVAEEARPERERELFITASVSNPRPFLGEQIVYTWRLHHRVRLTEARLEPYDFAGFQAEDLGDARELDVTLGGQLYRVHEIKKALFPQQVGATTVTGSAVECAVVTQRRGRGSMLDEMLGRLESEARRVKAPPVAVEVRALPPAPSGFGGLVGQFKLDTSVSRAELSTGQSTTLKITVAGSGNARLIGEPRIAGLEGFKVYDEKPQQSVERSGDEFRGRKVFTKSLVPLQAGMLTIPGASLVYFDPEAGRYETASSPPISLAVTPSAGQEDPRLTEALAPGGGKVRVTILADDILPIDKDLDAVGPTRAEAAGRAGFLAGLLLPPLAWMALYRWRRRQDRFASDRGLRRRLEALRKAQPLAEEAAAKWSQGAGAEASAQASRVLRQYIGDKVGVEGGALTADEAAGHLTARGVGAEAVARTRTLLLELEAMQYRSGAGGGAGEVDLLPLLSELERELAPRERGRAAAAALVAWMAVSAWGGVAAAELLEPALDGPPAEIFVRANSAYEAGDYGQAAELYQGLARRGLGTGALYYNLGNALLRSGELGPAVAAYVQARALLPRSSDLAANLAFARQSAKDALPPPEPSKVASTLFFWHYRLSRRELATVVLVANLLFWLALSLRLLRGRSEAISWAAWGAALLLLASGGSLALRTLSPTRIAVILPAEVEVKSATDPKALTRFKLHAGSEVRLEGRAGSWLRIHLPEGEPGWIDQADAQVIEH